MIRNHSQKNSNPVITVQNCSKATTSLRPRTKIKSRQRALTRKGVAAVEFAIVAPIFILLIIGILELGRAMMVQQILTNASRVGARSATMLNATEQQVIDTVNNYANAVSVPATTIVVSPSPSAASAGDEMIVTVSVPFSDVSWLPAPWFLGESMLTASSVMRKEGFE